MKRFAYLDPIAACLIVGALSGLNAAEPAADATAKGTLETVTVKEGPFKVFVAMDGIFESKSRAEVALHPDSWSDWSVLEAVEQGTMVEQGDLLISFDDKKLLEQLHDLESQRRLALLSIAQAESEIRLMEQSMPLDLEAAERASRIAEADLELFLSQDRELDRERADFNLKSNRNYLAYAKEELEQLLKMYEADDLTEETEEIVLKRTRDDVERSQFGTKMAEIDHDRSLAVELPRREEALRDAAARAGVALQKARTNLPVGLDRMRLELQKQREEDGKNQKRLNELTHDLALMKVRSPRKGMVYYGPCQRGKFPQAAAVAEKLRRGGHVSSTETIMTIVDPDDLQIDASAKEKDLGQLQRGLTGQVIATAFPALRIGASLDEVQQVPSPDGTFRCTVLIDPVQESYPSQRPKPGMTATVTMVAYEQERAITLPKSSVFGKPAEGEDRFVWLPGTDGKPEKKAVRVGRENDAEIEILEGLTAGDQVLKDAPKETS